LKPTAGNKILHEISNDNGVRVVNFATSKNPIVKSRIFPHRNIHKFTWTYPDGKIHNQIAHILISRSWPSIVGLLEVQSFNDTDHYLAAAKNKKRLAVSKQTTHRFLGKKFNVKKLKEVNNREQYRVEISNRFAASENLDSEVDINKGWETIGEDIKFLAKGYPSYYELKKHKPLFGEGCSELRVLYQRNKPYCSVTGSKRNKWR
jgi:hypothetical protein